MCKCCYCTSEQVEQTFGNMRQCTQEFLWADYCTLVEEETCRMEQISQDRLNLSREKGSGYFETHPEWVQKSTTQEV